MYWLIVVNVVAAVVVVVVVVQPLCVNGRLNEPTDL